MPPPPGRCSNGWRRAFGTAGRTGRRCGSIPARTSASRTIAWRSSTCRPRAPADALGMAAATSSPTTARSTIIWSAAEPGEGGAPAGAAIRIPRRCWPRSSTGVSRRTAALRRHVRVGRVGQRAHADAGPRPARREAAILRLAGRRSVPVRLRVEGAGPPSGFAGEIDRRGAGTAAAPATCRRRTPSTGHSKLAPARS